MIQQRTSLRFARLLLTLGTLAVLGCKKAPAEKAPPATPERQFACIQNIMDLDRKYAGERDAATEKISLKASIEAYMQKLDALDFSTCPGDFTAAFKNHELAWSEMMDIVTPHEELRGEMHAVFDELKSGADSTSVKQSLKKLADSWMEVEKTIPEGITK